jgi:hypothetical protein
MVSRTRHSYDLTVPQTIQVICHMAGQTGLERSQRRSTSADRVSNSSWSVASVSLIFIRGALSGRLVHNGWHLNDPYYLTGFGLGGPAGGHICIQEIDN